MIRSWFVRVTACNSILNIEYSMVVPGGPGSRRPYATANGERYCLHRTHHGGVRQSGSGAPHRIMGHLQGYFAVSTRFLRPHSAFPVRYSP